MSNRYNSAASFVPAVVVAPTAKPERKQQLLKQATEIANVPTTITVDHSMVVDDGSVERTSGMDRSKALVVRLLPFSVVWLILALGIGWGAGMGGWFVLCFFSGLTAVTYAKLDRQEYQFSRNGLERHKVDTLADLKLAEMNHHQELRRMALDAHLKLLRVEHE